MEANIRLLLGILNRQYARRSELTSQEKLQLIHTRIHVRAVVERYGGQLQFIEAEQRYVVALQEPTKP